MYREWAGRLKPTLRQIHPAGERLFVDFAGSTVAVMEGANGEARQAEIFVAVLSASSFTYACAVWSKVLPDWVSAHMRAFGYFGDVTRQLVSDNLKSDVTRACFYEPAVNRTYTEMAAHCGTAVLPAQPYKPGAAMLPANLPSGRAKQRDCRAGCSAERPHDAQPGHDPAGFVQVVRPAGAAEATADALRVCGVAALPDRARLPHHD